LRNQVRLQADRIDRRCEPYVEKNEFPPFLIEELKNLNLKGLAVKNNELYGGGGATFLEGMAVQIENGKCNANIATFVGLHYYLATEVIEHCGD
jgi:alkylation response protein AidB-like acyl-CoA dehydrogenase